MPNIIDMPKLSDTMTVGTLVKWLKNEGDKVATGDMLAEVETDKATMELECFFDGTLLKIFAPAGSQVAIGAPLCAIGQPGEKVEAPPAPPTAPPVEKKADDTTTTAPGASTTSKNEIEPRANVLPKSQPMDQVKASPAPSAVAGAAGPGAGSSSSAKATEDRPSPGISASPSSGRVRISPLARKLAAEKGIDPAQVQGSGPGGRIVRADILAAEKSGGAKAGAAPRAAAGTFAGAAPSRSGPIQEERTVAVSNMRGAIARRLLESKTQLPHFYVDIEVDAEPLLALRQQLNTALEAEGVKLSVNDFILKASAEALRRVPQVNASWEGSSSSGSAQAQIRYFAAAHVAFAVAMEDGLITPVIRDAHLKSVFAISNEAKALGKRAKEKKLKPEEFSGGTFTVSNLGMMGIPRFTAIINPPNAAILAVGTTVKKPVVKNEQIVVGQTITLTLSCDHRVVDGAVGAQYLGALKQVLEAPAVLLV